jgi:hypothetical protein
MMEHAFNAFATSAEPTEAAEVSRFKPMLPNGRNGTPDGEGASRPPVWMAVQPKKRSRKPKKEASETRAAEGLVPQLPHDPDHPSLLDRKSLAVGSGFVAGDMESAPSDR